MGQPELRVHDALRDARAIVVAGAISGDLELLDDLSELLHPEDIGEAGPALIYAAALRLADDGDPVSRSTVEDALREGGALDAAGGIAALWTLDAMRVDRPTALYHARALRGTAVRRKLYDACVKGAELAQRAKSTEADAAVEAHLDAVFSAFERDDPQRAVSMRDVEREVIDEVKAAHDNPGHFAGVRTGFVDWDLAMHGFLPGYLYVLGARPKMGKTALAVQIAINAAEAGHGVLYVTTEVQAKDIVRRVVASTSGVPVERMVSGMISPSDAERIASTGRRRREFNQRIMIADRACASLAYIRRQIRRFRRTAGLPPLGLVIVDHMHQMETPEAAAGRQDRRGEVSAICKGLLKIATAKEEPVPVFALAQLNRDCEGRPDKRPLTQDLGESGKIEQDASVIAFLYRDEVYSEHTDDQGVAEVLIRRQRNGQGERRVRLKYDPASGRFDNLARYG